MLNTYNPKKIEEKWQQYWYNNGVFETRVDDRKKFYALVEFPYPSGDGLHVGHPRPYTALDIVSRKRRLQGYNVLFPMGWDAFGLPAENYAIKNKIHPSIVTQRNVKRFKEQLQSIGFSFNWNREINTTDPDYYKWTQWIFIQMFKNGLAYKQEMPINWCPSCKTGLANEEVINSNCERCGTAVEHRVKNQWMLKITNYADRLIDDLDEVDYDKKIKAQQINWIGRSYGCELNFGINNHEDKLRVFTTRPDTLYGVTYMVIACEHPYIDQFKNEIKNYEEIIKYRNKISSKSELERTDLNKDKTGIKIDGLTAKHPLTDESIPIFVSDYVLMSYGTGAIMAVPAHDERDYEFAKKFNLEIKPVIKKGKEDKLPLTDIDGGQLINSPIINGLKVRDAIHKMTEYLSNNNIGEEKVNYKLRDWIFSRQRYWGEPIPMIHCEKCGWVPVPEEDLPVRLPKVEEYEPSGTGESPLANITSFVDTKCPKCGKDAKRETDTMPQWAGSSWYYIRYTDPKNDNELASQENIDYYLPVDWYNGGMEHTTLHLLYSRFWHKFLYDIGVVPTKEPYNKRTSHGMILGKNNEKMSKSRGNVVNPDDIVNEYGADTLRTYEMFIGDFEKSVPWSEQGVKGCRKFLDRVWKAREFVNQETGYSKAHETIIHQTIKKVSHDYEDLKFNTAIAQLMTLLNEFNHTKKITKDEFKTYLILLNPVAPHITEELWEQLGYGDFIFSQNWPEYDEEKTKDKAIQIPVQVNGKVRCTLDVAADIEKEELLKLAKANEGIQKYIVDKNIKKVIFVPGKILNIVIG